MKNSKLKIEKNWMKKNYFILTLLIAICTFCAIFGNYKAFLKEDLIVIPNSRYFILNALAKYYILIPDFSLFTSIIYIVIVIFYFKRLKRFQFDWVLIIISSLFAVFMIFGISFDIYGDWRYLEIANNFAIIQVIGWCILFYFLLNELYFFIKEHNCIHVYINNKLKKYKIAAFILICWIPIIFPYLPASFDWDSFVMLKSYAGEDVWSTHHPVIPAVLLGKIMDIGLSLGSANIGAFICMVLQTIMMLGAICYLLAYLKELQCPKILYSLTIFYFAICPVWAAFAQDIIKDSLNMVFCVVYVILYLKILHEPRWLNSKKNLIFFLCDIFLVYAFRNTGSYLIYITLFLLLISFAKRRIKIKRIGNIFLLCICIINVFNTFIIPAMGIVPGSKGEMLSIPFQQTARYLKEYPNDVSALELEEINSLLDANILGEIYDPNLSDPVKNTMHSEDLRDIKKYFNAWKSMFIKHPGVYIEATISNIYGYFYPDSISKARTAGLKFYIQPKWVDEYSPNTGTYDVHYFNEDTILRDIISFYANNIWMKLPVFSLFRNTGAYTWVLIICIALLIKYKKYNEVLGAVPSIVMILFCIASPVNGDVRYMLPVMAVTPLMIAWTLHATCAPLQKSNQEKEKNNI